MVFQHRLPGTHVSRETEQCRPHGEVVIKQVLLYLKKKPLETFVLSAI